MEQFDKKTSFQHRPIQILLIIFSLIAFIVTCIFNGLASGGPNGIFNQRTGSVSDENLTEFTPAGWTFSIWGIIYFWQAAWLLYSISRIFRRTTAGYLYLVPDTLHYYVFIFYIINLILNIVWLIVWDRKSFGWSFAIIFLMFVTVVAPLLITQVLLAKQRESYVQLNAKNELWFVRAFVHNGLAIYATWLFLASLLNLTIWICQIYNRNPSAIVDASTTAISLVFIGISVYFVLENFVFYSSLSYTLTPWFVLIFALCGIISKQNQKGNLVTDRNKTLTIILLAFCCFLIVLRLILFVFRYVRKQIPTLTNP